MHVSTELVNQQYLHLSPFIEIGGCKQIGGGDGVADTPAEKEANYGTALQSFEILRYNYKDIFISSFVFIMYNC